MMSISLLLANADMFSALDRYGFPVAILVVLGFAIWKGARWVSPLLQGVVDSHQKLVDSLSLSGPRMEAGIQELIKTNSDMNRLHYNPDTVFATQRNTEIVLELALHLRTLQDHPCPHIDEAIRIARAAIVAAEERTRTYINASLEESPQ